MATIGVAASAALLKPVIGKLSSEAWKSLSKFRHIDKKCDNIKNMLTTISTILTDAEKKSITDELIRHWLLQLQDVVYDFDDLLEDFQIEAKRRKKSKSLVKSAQTFFSSDNPIKFRVDMVKKLNEITKRLSKIMELKKTFKLVEGNVLMEEDKTERVTTSAVNESKVYGRKEEKEKLISHLLHDKNDEILSVLPLVGMGGVGKTTLAKMVCNDAEITEHFNPIIWVHVPMNFELSKILCKLIECSGEKCDVSEKEAMKNKLQAKISKTKFLVVLDDVWNDDAKKWEELETILICGEAGSKILVTTRSEKVAEIMGTFDLFRVNPLEFDDCCKLFKQRAFRHKNEDTDPVLVEIVEDIVRKCKGLPLAVEHLGNLAGSKKVELSVIRDSEIWQIEECGSGIVPSLLLSYSYLPSYLKQCFAYCSLFPKGYWFEKKYLTQLWTCEGFIPKNKPKADLCFDDLLSQSFFEVSERSVWDPNQYYIMHDLIHDLACHVAGDQFFLRGECENSQNTVSWRHSCIWLNDIVKIKKLRSLICYFDTGLGKKIDSIMLLHCLRVLNLKWCQIKVLPDSIGNLKHLRYLNVSSNYDLEVLPNSVTTLVNLQVLELSFCRNLNKLPIDLGALENLEVLNLNGCCALQILPNSVTSLINLQVLELSSIMKLNKLPVDLGALENLEVLNLKGCFALEVLPTSSCSLTNLKTLDLRECINLYSIPKGIGKLTKLESLPKLIIGGEEGCTIGELGQLNLLKNDLDIVVKEARGLQDIGTTKLGAKQYLKSLIFTIYQKSSDIASLEIPPQLENLCIRLEDYSYFGFDPPSALRTTDFPFKYRNLVSVVLHKINECDCFPQFGKLPKLKILDLSLQFPIIKLEEHFSGKCGMYPVLEELYLRQYSWEPAEKVEETEAMQEMFPCLKSVELGDCPFLSVFAFLPRSIENLTIKGDCGEQILSERSMQGLDQLGKLLYRHIPTEFNAFEGLRYLIALEELVLRSGELVYLPPTLLNQHVPSLKTLCIWSVDNLLLLEEERVGTEGEESSRCQPPPLFSTLENLQIRMCDSLQALPGWLASLPSLRSLDLSELPTLQNLPTGTEQLGSLQKLTIEACPELSKHYEIRKCEDGEVYYKKEEGGDWYDISHIPNIYIRPIRVVNKDGAEIKVRKDLWS